MSNDRAREAADRYAKMSPEERCVFAGEMIYRRIYARVVAPEIVDKLLTCRVCDRRPSQVVELTPFGNPKCTTGRACKPRNAVARMDQIPPWVRDPEGSDSIDTWTGMGGRGSGKSFTATGWFIPEVLKRADYRMGVLGPDFGISVGVAITGPCGFKTVIKAFDPDLIYKHDEQKNILTLANGSFIKSLSTENLKTIEGPEYSGYWCDELAELRGQADEETCVWRKRAEPGVRFPGSNGEIPRKIMTGTPEATPLIKHLADFTEKYPHQYAWTTLATKDNESNIANVEQRYAEATDADGNLNRYGLAKLEGHLMLESPHALLGEPDLAAIRVSVGDERHRTPAQMDTMILAVDANHSEDKKSDECGIIVMGRRTRRDDARIVHVFADASTAGGPKLWGERIIDALIAFPEITDLVVEDDKSLVVDVVKRVLREQLERIGRPIRVTPMQHGNKSKKKRADPVAVEYQIKHVLHDFDNRMPRWTLTALEWQWVSWNPKDTSKSPDRVDADVYGVTHLIIGGRKSDSMHTP